VSKNELIITAVVVAGRSQAEVARDYDVSPGWVSKLLARYRAEGDAAFTPKSRRPHQSPTTISETIVERICGLRHDLAAAGLDAGPDTIAWHLHHHHNVTVSPATISRHLTKAGLVTPEPKKRPKSSYIRFQAAMPNETWQSDFTHYPLTDHTDTEIITWLDDCTRMALHVSAHRRITAPIVVSTFRETVDTYGIPTSTRTDNGMVYTVRLAGIGRAGGRTKLVRFPDESGHGSRGLTGRG
jgi:transposase InsO family protein